MSVQDIFRKVPIEVPNKSGFDESHEHNFTAKVGTLVPCFTDLLLPNDSVSLSVGSEIQLPPMATDFYGRVKGHFEAFFVPARILYGGWQVLITHPLDGQQYPSGTTATATARFLPTLRIPTAQMGAGSLSDYFGYSFNSTDPTKYMDVYNPLKYLAYHKIWDSFYRDSRIQAPAFAEAPASGQSGGAISLSGFTFANLPTLTFRRTDNAPYVLENTQSFPNALSCLDGTPCYSLRQRNFARDYFTNATPLPQAGAPASVAFGISNNQGAFTIASLRAANSLQQWLERNNIAGYRYGDQIRAQFGIYPADAALDRPLYLGREIVDVYNKSVYQNDGGQTQTTTQNPFSSVGSKYGSPLGVGNGTLVDHFTASEHGYLFVLFSLVPDAVYSDTIDRDYWYNSMSDFPFPLLQGIGDMEISEAELDGGGWSTAADLAAAKANVFGYTQRYANHKFKLDRVSGLLKDGQNLQSFALQRSFSPQQVALGSQFLEIPTNYLDGVSAVSGAVSQYGCWVDSYFNYRKASTLAAYSIPTLGEPKNTHTEVVPNGGTRL